MLSRLSGHKRPYRGLTLALTVIPALTLTLQTSCAAQTPANPDPEIAALVAGDPLWAEDFTAPATTENWERGYAPAANAIGDRILLNGEMQVYTDAPYLNRDLLTLSNGNAALSAMRMTADDRQAINARMASEHLAARLPPLAAALTKATWVSTLLKGRRAFQYGYFEANLRQDADPSAWGAFWLLPQIRAWPPEIDIAEILTRDNVSVAHQTLHWKAADGSPAKATTQKPLIASEFHTYGVLWRPDWIMFFVDRQRTGCFATPASMNQPMYPLLNLAIGGWAAAPSASTASKITLDVNYVHYWPIQFPISPNKSFCNL